MMSKQVYVYDGSSSVQLKIRQKNSSMKAFMNYLSSFELFKGFFFPGGNVGPLPLSIGKNSWPLLMCSQYVLYSVHHVLNVKCSAGGVHNGRCTKY